MKRVLAAVAALSILAACDLEESSNEKQSDQQERMLQEGTSQVGMPGIKNFRERKLLKDIYELRDQDGLVTYTYLYNEMQGKLVFFCNSVGYGIPYSTQFTAGEHVEWYSGHPATLPQAEPNGLFSPASAEGTWVMCSDGDKTRPVYVEPRVVVSPFKLQ
jgi:hypothetical protein